MKKALSDFFTNSKIKEKINSEQFDLSNILIKKRLKLDFNLEKMAEIANFNRNHYLKMEYGDLDVELNDFNIAIKNIEKYEEILNKNHFEVKETYYLNSSVNFEDYSEVTKKGFNPELTNIEVKAA